MWKQVVLVILLLLLLLYKILLPSHLEGEWASCGPQVL